MTDSETPSMSPDRRSQIAKALFALVNKLEIAKWTRIEHDQFCYSYDVTPDFFDALREMDVLMLDHLRDEGTWYKRTAALFRLQPEQLWEQLCEIESRPLKSQTQKTSMKSSSVYGQAKTATEEVKVKVPRAKTVNVEAIPVDKEEALNNVKSQQHSPIEIAAQYPPITEESFTPVQSILMEANQPVTNTPSTTEATLITSIQADMDQPLANQFDIAIDSPEFVLRYKLKKKSDVSILFALLDHLSD